MNPASRRKGMWQLLTSSLHGRGRQVAGLAGWSLVQALPAYLSGHLVALAMDEGFLARRPGTGLGWLALLGASVLVGAWGTRQTYQRLAAVVELFRDELIVLAVTGALRRSTAAGASPDTAGVARLTRHVEIVREAYAGVLLVVQGFVVTTVSALLGLSTLVPAATVLVVGPLFAGLALFVVVLVRMASRQRASILAEERIAEGTSVISGGLRDVVACGAEETVCATVGEDIDAQARATTDLARLTAVRTVAVAVGGWLPAVLVLVAGPWLLRHGATTGAILGALTYVLEGVQPTLQTLTRELGGSALWLLVTLGRIAEATDLAPSPMGADAWPVEVWLPRREQDVRLRQVTFRYGPSAEPVIRELDLIIPEGDHLAVVGPSGVGKSTLAGLIAGILEPQTGEVRIGGVPVGDLDPQTLARQRVLIPQEAYVFTGTLEENLTYLRPGARRVEVDEAVDQLGVRPLAERLGGYAADLHPSSLSAGERQLLTLVRAYLSPARVVLLDEATCHLDPGAEAQVEQAFARRPGTLLVIAHRISSALRARRILVLDGTQTLLGTHEDLVATSALYRDLVGRWLSVP